MTYAKTLYSIYRPSLSHQPLHLDFLLPATFVPSLKQVRYTSTIQKNQIASTSSSDPSASPSPPPYNHSFPSSKAQPPPLSPSQTAYLTSALRVNLTGELAATLIYASQTPPLLQSHPHLRPLLQHMYDQEAGHLSHFEALCAKHRIRPTALTPVWKVAAGLLGWGTGLMGKEAAMACTEAVETEIGGHYNGQVRELLRWKMEAEAGKMETQSNLNGGMPEETRKSGLGEELQGLLEDVRRIRDEELEHLDEAVGEDAKEAKAYPVLNWVVRAGCRGAIWATERI